MPCRHSLAVAQGLIMRNELDLSEFDGTRCFHKAWLTDTHNDAARNSARLSLSMFRLPRRMAPSDAAPLETRAEQVQGIVSEARMVAQALAHDPAMLQLLRLTMASIYRQGVGLSTDEIGRVELVRPLAGTTERARQAAGAGSSAGGRGGGGRGVANAPTARGRGRGREARMPNAGQSAKRRRGAGRAA